MYAKWSLSFIYKLVILWLLYVRIVNSARQVCLGTSVGCRTPWAYSRSQGFVTSIKHDARPRRWKCCGLPTRKVADGTYIKDINYYNQFPSFAQGVYGFHDLCLAPELSYPSTMNKDEVVSTLVAISGIKHLILLPNGHLKLSRHCINEPGTGKVKGHNLKSISNFTLGMLKYMYEGSNEVNSWLKELHDKEYRPLSLSELVDTDGQCDARQERKELESWFDNLVKERQLDRHKLQIIGWKYIPFCKMVKAIIRVVPMERAFAWVFKLPPGPKSIRINDVKLKTIGKEDIGPFNHGWPLLGTCTINTGANVKIRLRKPPAMEIRGMHPSTSNVIQAESNRSEKGSTATDKAPKENVTSIEVSGPAKTRYNVLIKVIIFLHKALITTDSHKILDPRTLTVDGDMFYRPFWIQKLTVLLNGKLHSYLPLLVMYAEEDGTYHLCTRDIRLEPKGKHCIWNPWKGRYVIRNLDLIPPLYRGMMFAETHNFEITRENIQQLLTKYRALDDLDISGYFSGVTDKMKRQVRNIIHIDENNKYMVNVVT